MFKKKFIKKFTSVMLALSLVVTGLYLPVDNASAASISYKNKKCTVIFKDFKGIKKLTVNGKKKSVKKRAKTAKVKFTKEGMFTVKLTNRKGKTTTRKICIDLTKPTVSGVKNGESYTTPVTVSIKDKYGISSCMINEQKIGAPYEATIKGVGAYKVTAKDKAGNVTTIQFSIKSSEVNGNTATNIPVTPVVTFSPAISSIPNATVSPKATDVPLFSFSPVVTNAPEVEVTKKPVESGLPFLPTMPPIFSTPEVQGTPEIVGTPLPTVEPVPECVHEWVLVSVISEPTCYSTGKGQYKCSKCEGTKEDTIAKTAHKFTQVVDDERCCVKKTTCTEDGEYYLVCEDCGEVASETSTVQATGHSFKKQIASDEYLKESATKDHGDIYYLACENCDAKSNSESDTWDNNRKLEHTVHTFTDTSVVSDSNLANPASCTEPQRHYCKCTECDTFSTTETFVSGEALGHDFSATVMDENHVASKATCQNKAKYYCKCSRCAEYADNYDKSKVFEAGELAQHTFTKENASSRYFCKEATCQNPAQYYKCCELCDESAKDIDESAKFYNGEKVDHKFCYDSEKEKYSDPTCQHGTQFYRKCMWCDKNSKDKCNELLSQGKNENSSEIQALLYTKHDKVDHSWENRIYEGRVKDPATCTKPATFWRTCKWCLQSSKNIAPNEVLVLQDNYTGYGQALGHDISDDAAHRCNEVEVSAAVDGSYQLRCTRPGCNFVHPDLHITATHTDVYQPGIKWSYYWYNPTNNKILGETSSFSRYVSGDISSQYTVPSTAIGCPGVLNIDISDSYNGKSSSGIKRAYLVFNNRGTQSLEEMKRSLKNGNTKLDSTDITKELNTDSMAANFANINFSESKWANFKSAKSCRAYIYVEDYAGNISCFMSPQLYVE